MPELPEVETIVRVLHQEAAGLSILGVEILDPSALHPTPEAFSALVTGRHIQAVRRRAKLAIFELSPRDGDAGALMAAHLRMTGRLTVGPETERPERARAILRLSGGRLLAFCDLRRFGSLHAFLVDPDDTAGPAGPGPAPGLHSIESWPFYAGLGPEPLEIDAPAFIARIRGAGAGRARIKALLLDQTVIAGVGNIYADESLFRAGIRPDAPAGKVSDRRLAALFRALQAVLAQAIAENGSSIRDYRDAHGDAGAFQNHFQAYGRAGQPCHVCGGPMQALRVAGRTSTFCPHCQR